MVVILRDQDPPARSDLLGLAVTKGPPESLVPLDTMPVLDDSDTVARQKMIETLAPFLAGPMNGEQVKAILGNISEDERLYCLRRLCHLIERPVSMANAQAIPAGMPRSSKDIARRYLSDGIVPGLSFGGGEEGHGPLGSVREPLWCPPQAVTTMARC